MTSLPPEPPDRGGAAGAADEEALPPGSPRTWECNWAVFCHLGGIAGYFTGVGHLLVPLVLWLLRRDRSAFVDDQGRAALDFQISVTLYFLAAGALTWLWIGFLLLPALLVFHFVFMIVASVHASEGDRYRYPWTLRFLAP